jgi:hypothetical protein
MYTPDSDLPVLISKFDVMLEQIQKLIKDIETNKWDSGVAVIVNNGSLDIRGLGECFTPAAAAALLFAGIKSLPPCTQSDMMKELMTMMERSTIIAKEAPLWRGKAS